MSKKTNTLLFVVGATVFNVLITILSFWLLIFLAFRVFNLHRALSEDGLAWSFPILFIVAVVISFFVYRVLIKYLMTKIDPEKYFDPIFTRKYKKR